MITAMASLAANAEITASDAWARATPPGMPMGAVYTVFQNSGDQAVEVIGLETPVARAAEIHESVEIEGQMRMREITPFIIPAKDAVRLEPGGKHVMLMGLKRALVQGERFPLLLKLSDGSTLPVEPLVGGFGQMEMPEQE